MTKRQLKGTVVSNAMQKTVVVKVTRYEKHPKYGKYVLTAKKYKAHDEAGHKEGDVVIIEECPPISREKYFKVIGSESKASVADTEEPKDAGITGGLKKLLHFK